MTQKTVLVVVIIFACDIYVSANFKVASSKSEEEIVFRGAFKKRDVIQSSNEEEEGVAWRLGHWELNGIPRQKRSPWRKRTVVVVEDNLQRPVEYKLNHCATCHIYFKFNTQYEEHCRDVHDTRKTYQCVLCKETYKTKRNVKRHMLLYHGKEQKETKLQQFTCELCGETFEDLVVFEVHCQMCRKRAKITPCAGCDDDLRCKLFKSPFLESDVLKAREEDCYQKRITHQQGANKFEIQELEILPQRRTYCKICDVTLKTYAELKKHYTSIHPSSKIFDCDFCGKSYSHWKTFQHHFRYQHPKESMSNNANKFLRMQSYMCEYCDQEIKGVANLELHSLKFHPGCKIFFCRDCRKGFLRKRNMERHVREHHGEEKVCCSYCARFYYRMDELHSHEERCKKNKKEYCELGRRSGSDCPICGLTFYTKKYSFRRHVVSHSVYDFCSVCGERFHRSNNPEGLSKHYNMRHPLRANIDALLDTITTYKVNLKAEPFSKEDQV